MAVLLLNPSVADEYDLDPTLRRVQRYAMEWGFGGMRILNAFSIVSTNPAALLRQREEGSKRINDEHINRTIRECPLVVVGWAQI